MTINSSCKITPVINSNIDVQIKVEDLNEECTKPSTILLRKTRHPKTVTTTRGYSHRRTHVSKLKHVFIPLTKIKQRQPEAEQVTVTTPPTRRQRSYTFYGDEDIKKFIFYIVHDGIDIQSAAKKMNIPPSTASEVYDIYLSHPQHQIPTSVRSCNIPSTVFLNKNYRYLKSLYDCDPDIKLCKLKELLSAEFPDVNVTITNLRYIQKKMRGPRSRLFKPVLSSGSSSNENKRWMIENHTEVKKERDEEEKNSNKKLSVRGPTSEHTAFLKHLLETQPSLPLYKLKNRLVENFPGLMISVTAVSNHMQTYLSDLYQRSTNPKKERKNRLIHVVFNQEQKDFFDTMLREQSNISKAEIKASLEERFPYLKLGNSYKLSIHIENYLNNWEEIERRRKAKADAHVFPLRLNDEHKQFLVDNLKNDPYIPVVRLRWRLLETYPGLQISYLYLTRYLRLILKKSPNFSSPKRPYKMIPSELEFVKNQVFKERPNIDIQRIFHTLVNAFPDYNSSYFKFVLLVRHQYPVEYQRRKIHHVQYMDDIVKQEHITFLRNLFKSEDPNQPETTSTAHLALLRAFPDVDFTYNFVQSCIRKMTL